MELVMLQDERIEMANAYFRDYYTKGWYKLPETELLKIKPYWDAANDALAKVNAEIRRRREAGTWLM